LGTPALAALIQRVASVFSADVRALALVASSVAPTSTFCQALGQDTLSL
jgi:hypothetical protein